MRLLTPAIALLLLSILVGAIYTYRTAKVRNKQPSIVVIYGSLVLCVVLLVAGAIMLFIAAGWKWGLAGLGISWLVFFGLTFGITTAYRLREYVDPLSYKRVNEVITVEGQHKAELDDFWNLTSSDERASLVADFFQELKNNWTNEYSQLNSKQLPDAVSDNIRNGIKQAYAAGYMMGKGWISMEHLADFNIYLGDKMASDLRLVFNGAKSNGNAFASGYTTVATRGHLKVLQKTLGNR